MSIADQFPRCSFGSVVFPVESIHIAGGMRSHVHEYPHSDGGAPEKLGRSLYRVSVAGNFQDRFAKYPGLYPEGLRRLVEYFDAQQTLPLIVPTFGTLQAFCTKWDREFVAKIRSGEKMTLDFLEDLGPALALEALVSSSKQDQVTLAAAFRASWLAAQKDKAISDSDAKTAASLFDQIQSAVNTLAVLEDTVGVYGGLISAKCAQITSCCFTLDRLASLQGPRQTIAQVVEDLHALWASTVARLADLQKNQVQLRSYTTPSTMSIQSISTALYGDATHTDDLLSLNPVATPFRVLAGTTIRYYPASS